MNANTNTRSAIKMPNLPGMMPRTDSWALRHKTGFKKSLTVSRPGTAEPIGQSSLAQFFADQSRPGTSSGQRFEENGISFYDNNANSPNERVMNLSSSMPNFHSNFQANATEDWQRVRTPGSRFSRPSTAGTKLPVFVEKDRQVMRFYGHFFQKRNWEKDTPLGDPLLESEICRHLTILYYLIDDEVEINEPKVVNSGIPYGVFFRKGKLALDGADRLLQLRDLAPGAELQLLGQKVYITDADSFTRKYYEEELGIAFSEALPRPRQIRPDIGAQYATGMGAQALPQMKSSFGTRSTNYADIREVKDKTNQYLRYDGRVLRFQCVEVASDRPPYFPHLQAKMMEQGYYQQVASADVKRFALAFFLSTNNIELVVQRSLDSKDNGHGEPKLILKKSKLPRNWREAQRGKRAIYYQPQDFRCGGVIDVFGRRFLLVNCDKFTRDLYRTIGIEQEDVLLVAEEQRKIQQPIPQLGDGFLAIGSREDTLSTVYGMPKPRKDMEKVSRNQGRLIRCRAVLLTNKPIDSSREFLVTFYLEDDTLQVYEDTKRNSGIWGGTFLKRGKYKNDLPSDSDVPRDFLASDIYLGNVISLHGNEFQITEMDNASLMFCENYPHEFPLSDTFKIIGNMMRLIIDLQLDIRPKFRDYDVQKKLWISQDEFVRLLLQLGLTDDLNDQELLTLMRRFKDDDSGDVYYYDELCDLISHVFLRSRSNYVDDKGVRHKKGSQDLSNFKTFITSARLRTIQWRRLLRKDENTVMGYLTLAILDKLFQKHGYKLSEEILNEMQDRYSVDDVSAAPILKELKQVRGDQELFDRFDRKVVHKHAHATASSSGSLQHQQALVTAKLAAQRRRESSVGSVLRRKTNFTQDAGAEFNGRKKLTDTLIDYNKFCDDIYLCDWI